MGLGSFLGGAEAAESTSTSKPWSRQQRQLVKDIYGYSGDDLKTRLGLAPVSDTAVFDPSRANQLTDSFLNGQMGRALGGTGNQMTTLQDFGAPMAARAGQAAYDATGNLANRTLANAGTLFGNPNLDGAITAATRDVYRNLQENQLTNAANAAEMTGNTNSSAAAVERALLQRGAQDRAGDIAAGMRFDAYNRSMDQGQQLALAELQGLQTSANQGLGAASTANQTVNALMGAGAGGQGIALEAAKAQSIGDQSQLDYEQGLRDFRNRELLKTLPIATSNTGQQTTGVQTSGGNVFGNVAGLGLGAAGIAAHAGLFSDRRLKVGIQPFGQLPSGLKTYTYHYVWGGPLQVGVMAQEAAEIFPDAVLEHESGYLMVDYTKIS